MIYDFLDKKSKKSKKSEQCSRKCSNSKLKKDIYTIMKDLSKDYYVNEFVIDSDVPLEIEGISYIESYKIL
jgi:hypothetical protein